MPDNILRFLKGKKDYISGQEISSALGITRAAVWKKIRLLRSKGFIIAASPSKGYRLVSSPDLSIDEIRANVVGSFWRQVLFYEQLESTNETATSLSVDKDIEGGVVILTDAQSRGKGRLGRAWVSPPGSNIYMSIILKPELSPKDSTLLTLLAAVASATALRKASGLAISIKWPNDLMIADKKTGGILTEVRFEPDKIKVAVIGIGINVNIEKKDFPDEIKNIATSLKEETGQSYARSNIIVLLLKEIEAWYKLLMKKGRGPLLEEWNELSSTIGKRVTVSSGKEVFAGKAEGIDEEGLLIIRLQSGALKKVSAGDVTILK